MTLIFRTSSLDGLPPVKMRPCHPSVASFVSFEAVHQVVQVDMTGSSHLKSDT